ncbi:MAG: AhpC/TSA family protein [Bacteroidaceae bacterium]|nr:AhpC/TSA family protein [Bacteroidaceae bacterium]
MKIKTFIGIISMTGVVALTSCNKNPQFCVEGTIEEAKGETLYLEAMTLDGIQCIDSVKLKDDGQFRFTADAPSNPEFYALRLGEERINFSIDSTETVTFTAQRPTFSSSYTVEGSLNCQKIKEIAQLQSQLQSQVIALEQNTSMYPGDISDSINTLVKNYKEHIKANYIFQDPQMAYAYYAVCQSITDLHTTYQLFNPLSNRDDVKCYATIATAWDGLYPDAKRTEQICNLAIQGMNLTAPPTQKVINIDESKISEVGIIDIALPDITSTIRRLTDLKGKVVMLDFTLYGASESPERTRKMRQLYEQYHARGFEIYQVALDDDIHFWKLSCEKLPWICVHETDGSAMKIYGVVNLPTYFLINRENELVKRSDQVTTSLEEEIQQLLK